MPLSAISTSTDRLLFLPLFQRRLISRVTEYSGDVKEEKRSGKKKKRKVDLAAGDLVKR